MNALLQLLESSVDYLNLGQDVKNKISIRERNISKKGKGEQYVLEIVSGQTVFFREITTTSKIDDNIKKLTIRTLIQKLITEGIASNYKALKKNSSIN